MKAKQKINSLRNNEYYNFQPILDELYDLSKKGSKFKKLMELITDERNILLAYRNIKKNKGSMTYGTDKKTILDIAESNTELFIEKIQNKLSNYKPKPIRRVYIPKKNGKLRPLGIPCIEDRIIQQCIKQILEPILEAKFYKHSYGFRPDRGCKYAIARCNFLINKSGFKYVVDIDIKGFFDNVNHSKLKKQLWTLGIRDKRLICVISKMLKAEITGVGIPSKGTPQGGVLSPLLANVVLNEFDWWIASQWDTFPTRRKYHENGNTYRALRTGSNLKEIRIVRYADDFKIFCKDYVTANKIMIASKKWIKERLNLDCSTEKSKITNLTKNYSEFLGIKFKACKKRNSYISRSYMSESSIAKCKKNIINGIKRIYKYRDEKSIMNYNSIILGMHHYYDMATCVAIDLGRLDYDLRKTLYNRLHKFTEIRRISEFKGRLYKGYSGKTYGINGMAMYPIYACKNKPPMSMNQDITRYTKKGRKLIHESLNCISKDILEYLSKNPILNKSVEYNDNRLSVYCGQRGKCFITKKPLEIGEMHLHHKKPISKGGNDKYQNLVYLNKDAHTLVHSTNMETIKAYLGKYKWDVKRKDDLNKLRKLAGNFEI